MTAPPPLEARAIARQFAGTGGVRSATLALAPGQITALLGPSGSGKSTLLRVLAGLEPVDSGTVLAAGEVLSRPGLTVPPERRHVGVVFQDFALFPHLTVLENIAFGLTHLARDARIQRAAEHLARVGLAHRARSRPHQLSGGEQQRVALARALAPEPVAVLLDEPFSGLDPGLRADLRDATFQTLKQAGIPALLVTHEADEALLFADRIAVMDAGVLVQEAEPADLYDHPASLAAMAALGRPNTCPATASKGQITTPFGPFTLPDADGTGTFAIRPEALDIIADADGSARVIAVQGAGPSRALLLAPHNADAPLWRAIRPAGAELPAPGSRVRLHASRPHFFPTS